MKPAAVIIPAAGRGERMGLKTPKPFLPLGGEPMVAKTINIFHRISRIGYIQPVVPRALLPLFRRRLLGRYAWRKCLPPVAGGRERQDSVYHGLRALPDSVELVLVHDAARPLVTAAVINRVMAAAWRHGAAVAAVRVKDTIKKSSPPNLVEKTVDRRGLWLVQTPQAFHASLLMEAHSRAAAEGYRGTDEASLVERMRHPVHLVQGSALNMKITTREDLVVARCLVGTVSRPAPKRARGS